MNLNKLLGRKRAVSPVVAAILLIGLTVAAGAMVYFIVLPMLSGESDADDITVTFDGNGTSLVYKFRIQNGGASDVTVASVTNTTKVDAGSSAVTITITSPSDGKIGAGKTENFVITVSFAGAETSIDTASQSWRFDFTDFTVTKTFTINPAGTGE